MDIDANKSIIIPSIVNTWRDCMSYIEMYLDFLDALI